MKRDVLIRLDAAQVMALDQMAAKYGRPRVAMIRDLIYTGIWNEYRVGSGMFRTSPTQLGACDSLRAQRGRIVSVDQRGLSLQADEIQRLANATAAEHDGSITKT